jgi:hypothetical protein
MNEQKNKTQQPHQGNKQDKEMNQQGQKSDRQDQDKKQGKGEKQHAHGDTNQSDKRTEIDDNPDETKKKIPNMELFCRRDTARDPCAIFSS